MSVLTKNDDPIPFEFFASFKRIEKGNPTFTPRFFKSTHRVWDTFNQIKMGFLKIFVPIDKTIGMFTVGVFNISPQEEVYLIIL